MTQPTLEELLRVSPPMLWLDEIVSRTPSSVRCRPTPRSAHPFVEDGRIEALISLEWMGQAAALLAALIAHDAGEASVARRLASVAQANFACTSIEPGVELVIDARQTSATGFACSVQCGDKLLASAVLELQMHAMPERA